MSERLRGRLFGPELPGAGIDVSGEWRDERLHLELPRRRLISGELRVGAAGFNQSQLRLEWSADGQTYAVAVGEGAQSAALVRGAPPHLRRALDAAVQERVRIARRFRRLAWALSVLGLLLAAGLVALLASAPRLAASVARRIPVEHEVRLGELVLAQSRATMPIIERGVMVEALGAVGARLVPTSRFRYRWYVARSPELNAFAAPGGIVVATTGLLGAADSAEELAGVLAHEIAHTELRHGTQRLLETLGLRVMLALLLGQFEPALGEGAASLTELKFSRDAEREADQAGLARLRAARVEPHGMVRLFEKLAGQGRSAGLAPPAFLSSHPDIRERIRWLETELDAQASLPGSPTPLPIAVDYAAVKRAAME